MDKHATFLKLSELRGQLLALTTTAQALFEADACESDELFEAMEGLRRANRWLLRECQRRMAEIRAAQPVPGPDQLPPAPSNPADGPGW